MNRPVMILLGVVIGAVGMGLFLSRPSTPDVAPAPMPAEPGAMAAPRPSGLAGWRPVQPGSAPSQAEPAAPASPREEADSLFNVVMSAAEKRDQQTVVQALPEALSAYAKLGPLDGDGIFHVALLQLTGGRFAEARATAQKLLADNPNHLLALSVSARAAAAAGDAAAARDFNQRLLRAYDSEVVKPLVEYRDHARVLPLQRAEAEAALKD